MLSTHAIEAGIWKMSRADSSEERGTVSTELQRQRHDMFMEPNILH
jgi:hypothetical protein